MKKTYLILLLAFITVSLSAQDTAKERIIRDKVTGYFTNYNTGHILVKEKFKVTNVSINAKERILTISLNDVFGVVPFTAEQVKEIYSHTQQLLPQPYNAYTLHLRVGDYALEDLVVGGAEDSEAPRTWGNIVHKGNAWVTPLNRAYSVESGLPNRHISLWASHGRYYDREKNEWQWQRPRLFCTTEDLLTQTFVVPLLIPMLENAGAVVFSPRERDWQRNEVVVDNDRPQQNGLHSETNGQHAWLDAGKGFAHIRQIYSHEDNPFQDGTARMCATQTNRRQQSFTTWTPVIPANGRYAVYVSYKTLPTSVSDAEYTVRHRGQTTRFQVNQQMGGGTWVYLGTFDFSAGQSADNCVRLSNHSSYRGHITADAVRFGGGMGNVARGVDSTMTVSGLPRFLECSRYYAQWAGMPTRVYANIDSVSDYREDINTRSHMTNYLAGGSCYLPADTGLRVPIDLSLAFHTDAGITANGTPVGTLAIYHSHDDDGLLPTGMSRMTSRDLSDIVQSQVYDDLKGTIGMWTRRQMWDKNYSESRRPRVPSLLLEMLSHQNFPEMRLAHDPYFKFLMARAIYKGVLRYEAQVHGQRNVVVQPLPITAPQTSLNIGTRSITLSWMAQSDPLEPTAMPTSFVVYHAEDDSDFDNGTLVREANYELTNATVGVLHRFKVTAVNDGGQSLPSEEVCAYISQHSAHQVLIVDAFDRMSGPLAVANDSIVGFDMAADMGIPMAQMPGYCGQQVCFDPHTAGSEGEGALGHSINNTEGMILAGNTRDWTTRHARDIITASAGGMHIASCTTAAVERLAFDQRPYDLMDIVCGLEQRDGYSLRQNAALTEGLRQAIASHVRSGGSILLSGSYVGSDARTDDERLFLRSVLKFEPITKLSTQPMQGIYGLGTTFDIERNFSERTYRVSDVGCINATEQAFCAMTYQPAGESAAVAYQGTDYRAMTLGFPWESITDKAVRTALMAGILNFLLP